MVKVTGRYPEKGNAVNTECKEMAYIIDGKGDVTIKGKTFNITTEDLVVIDKGEEYFWDGEFKLFVYCTPAWSPSQHKVVD